MSTEKRSELSYFTVQVDHVRQMRLSIFMQQFYKIQQMVLNEDFVASLLVVSTIVLFVTENLFHYPIAIMSILGFIRLARYKVFGLGVKYLCWVFLAIWLPMFFATLISSNPLHSWKTTIAYLHFLPMAYYVVVSCSRDRVGVIVSQAMVLFCFCLVLDACVQFVSGSNLFGYPLQGNSVTGLFHPKQRLGLFLAVLAPFFIHFLWVRERNSMLFLISIFPYLFVILVSLKRNSWLMLFIGLVIFALVQCKGSLKTFSKTIGVAGSVIFLVVSLLYLTNPPFNKQIRHSYGLLSGDVQVIDQSSNHRLALWDVGLKIFAGSPFFGIGPRGYRYEFKKHANTENFWIKNFDSGQTHPHLMSLEILVETGIAGLLAYFFVLLLLLKLSLCSAFTAPAKFWLIGAFLAWLPFNTHLAFYGSYWASFVWLLLALGLTGLQKDQKDPIGR